VTLNGEKTKLKMGDGTSDQVDCLSNADAYVPSADLSTDVAAVLQQCQVAIIILSAVISHDVAEKLIVGLA